MCRVPELFSEKYFPCISNLLAVQPTYHDSCKLIRSHYPQAFTSALVGSVVMDERELNSNQKDVIYHIHYNEYVLLTSGVTVKLVCHDKPSHNVALKGGVYHIELSHPCRLIGDGWLLIATFTMMGNLTLQDVPRARLPKVTLTDILTSHVNLSLPELTPLSTIGHERVPLTDYTDAFKPTVSPHWYDRYEIMLILGGIGLLTIVIIVFCTLYYRKYFSLPYGILHFPCVKFTREINTVDEIEAVEMHEIQTNAAEVQCERVLYVAPEGEKVDFSPAG